MSDRLLATGKTHNVSGKAGSARSDDGWLDVQISDPHPAAEKLFGAAWSACFMGAIQLAAQQQKIALPTPPYIDAEIDLNHGDGGFFLRARLNVTIPDIAHEEAQAIVQAAHQICPYSKATRGNIDVTITVI